VFDQVAHLCHRHVGVRAARAARALLDDRGRAFGGLVGRHAEADDRG
jgi:hypothetical protein